MVFDAPQTIAESKQAMRANIENMYKFISEKLRDPSESESLFMRKLHLPMVKLLACFPRQDSLPLLIQLALC